MDSRNRRRYGKMLLECRARIETLKDMHSEKHATTYLQTTIESEALQIRKILELIAFSSLISYQEEYIKVRNDISKDWHAERILKKIEKINPNFYPVPVRGIKNKNWVKLRGGFLTRKQFAMLYDSCGAILHAQNPFSKGKSSLAFHKKVPKYISQIEELLLKSRVKLAKEKEFLLFSLPLDQDEPIYVQYLVQKSKA